jgi:hypothetical protein
MSFTRFAAVSIAVTIAAWCPVVIAQLESKETTMVASGLKIPESIEREHEAIHSALIEATKAPGRAGAAARALAEVLHPHFVREEEIALPPLGLVAPLASGQSLPDAVLAEAERMTNALRAELPKMLEEHLRIRAAVAALHEAAQAEGASAQIELAEALALHARTEEEVLYPAAILVGDAIRARRQRR